MAETVEQTHPDILTSQLVTQTSLSSPRVTWWSLRWSSIVIIFTARTQERKSRAGLATDLPAQHNTWETPASGVCRSWWPPGRCPCRSHAGRLWCSHSEGPRGPFLRKPALRRWSPRSQNTYQRSAGQGSEGGQHLSGRACSSVMELSRCLLHPCPSLRAPTPLSAPAKEAARGYSCAPPFVF